ALGGPSGDAIEVLLLCLSRRVVVVHAPGHALADAVKAKHALAYSHGKEAGKRLEIGKLATRPRPANAVGDANGQLVGTRQPGQGLILFGREIMSARIE